MYIVAFPDNWYLRGTVATGSIDRATHYTSRDEAAAALVKASKFMKRAAVKAARIVEVAAQ